MNLELQATPEEVMRAVEALQEFGSHHGLSEKDMFGLSLALEECGSNIVNHGLRRDSARKFKAAFEFVNGNVVITLRDPGPEFDPTLAPPDERHPDEAHGGWGIELVRRFTDKLIYRREDGENVLRLTKHFARGSEPA
jgi:serine/threonine-protein kinase RsbW